MGTRQHAGLRSVIHTVVPPAAKNSHSHARVNSQSFPRVSVSHDHVWAHKLNMLHLLEESLFSLQIRIPSAPGCGSSVLLSL